jgi:hypothetical protein
VYHLEKGVWWRDILCSYSPNMFCVGVYLDIDNCEAGGLSYICVNVVIA